MLEEMRKLEGDFINPTISERYLGIYLSSNMSWQHYIYGENWRTKDNFPGLISILNSRIGMLKKIRKFASKEKMLIMIDGIVLSKLRYNLGIIGNTWLKSPYRDTDIHYKTFTKKDNNRLQVVMNKALKLAVGQKDTNYPTTDLLKDCRKLSIHQETAFQVGMQARKILETGRPKFLREKIKMRDTRNTRRNRFESQDTRRQLTNESFVNQSISLLNLIPPEILATEKRERFRKVFRDWIINNIPVKP